MVVSILVPICDINHQYISDCIYSVINQTYNNWELILGVNGIALLHIDYLNQLQEEDPRIRVIPIHQKGKVNTLNEMVLFAKFDIICLLDINDYWHKNKLQYQLNYINHYDVVGTFCHYINDAHNIIGKSDLKDGIITFKDLQLNNQIINSSCMMRKENAYWSNEFYGLEDYNLWLELGLQGKTFFNINKLFVCHRLHNNSHLMETGTSSKYI